MSLLLTSEKFFDVIEEDDVLLRHFEDEKNSHQPKIIIPKLIKFNKIIPLTCMQCFWDDEEVATIDKLKNKKKWKYTGADTKNFYLKNLKENPEDWYYRDHEVYYTLNSHGYRTREFNDIDWENSIVMFGCSHVFCSGVDDSHTISSFLEKITGRPVINMGIPGGNCFSTFYTSMALKKTFSTPYAVIFSWTSLERHSLIKKYSVEMYGSWNMSRSIFSGDKEFHDDIISRNIMNINFTREFWKNINCKYYEYTHFIETKNMIPFGETMDFYNFYGKIDWARDFSHHGPKTNLKIAKKIAYNLSLI